MSQGPYPNSLLLCYFCLTFTFESIRGLGSASMMLINHIFNMHSNIFLKTIVTFLYFFGCPNLYKQVKANELLNILHFQQDVTLKCICKFSTFKCYNRIHQTSNGKVGLKLNLMSHFQTYLLSIFIMQRFFKFCNHFITKLKKNTMFLLCYLI